MKITIEVNSIEELEAIADRFTPTYDIDSVLRAESPDEIIERVTEEQRAEELTPAQKAAKTRAANKAKREREAIADAHQAREEADAEAAASAPVKQEEEPLEGELLPAEPEPESNVVPMTTVEGDADAEALVQAAAAQDDNVDMDALRDRFHALVQNDWDAAAKILDDLGVDNFTEAMGAGFASSVAQKLGEVAVA